MSRKIKLHTFHVLFRLFAYLADKSGGWRVFVRPKLLLGSLIVGLGLTVTGMIEAQNQSTNEKKKDFLKNRKDTIPSTEVEEMVFCYISEQMPQYPGGESALLNFVYKNLKYPESAIKDNIQGKVIMRFVVTESGNVDKVEVIRSLQPDCDKEAIRVIKKLHKFTPGKQSGKLVSVWYTMPITFKLNVDVQKN
jgi:TonB family protein